jgi:hypothetical protein
MLRCLRWKGKMGKHPKYPPGTRVVVSDIDAIERYGKYLPMVGWVDHNEEILNGRQHMGWYVHVRSDEEGHDNIVKHPEDQVSKVEVRRYGKLLCNQPAISCPWCLKHGRDPRLPEHYVPHLPDCQCWHHTHDEHMEECPHGK